MKYVNSRIGCSRHRRDRGDTNRLAPSRCEVPGFVAERSGVGRHGDEAPRADEAGRGAKRRSLSSATTRTDSTPAPGLLIT